MSRYIDADKLIEFANNTKDKTIDANDIARFPIADVRENVKGEWIIKKDVTECSNCHTKWNNYRGLISTFDFCPDCGADMREEE